MVEPLPVKQCDSWLNGLSPRMLSISPAFQAKDLSTLGLLRFAYGQPTHFINFVLGGLLIGLSVGFLLAIGRDVGAARWIFGMGATGAIAGTCLGVLSGGFRLGVGVMLLSTLLSLLTPTFNTVITNQALPDRDLGLLLQISVILAAAGMTRVCFEWVQSRAVQLSQQRGAARSQLAGMHRLLRLPAEFFSQAQCGRSSAALWCFGGAAGRDSATSRGWPAASRPDQHLHLVHAAHQREADGSRSACCGSHFVANSVDRLAVPPSATASGGS